MANGPGDDSECQMPLGEGSSSGRGASAVAWALGWDRVWWGGPCSPLPHSQFLGVGVRLDPRAPPGQKKLRQDSPSALSANHTRSLAPLYKEVLLFLNTDFLEPQPHSPHQQPFPCTRNWDRKRFYFLSFLTEIQPFLSCEVDNKPQWNLQYPWLCCKSKWQMSS